jgi:hypothetical protein
MENPNRAGSVRVEPEISRKEISTGGSNPQSEIRNPKYKATAGSLQRGSPETLVLGAGRRWW